jgi:hypothetical protein
VFEILVLDKINITPEDITARYEADIETYALPGHRTIQALFFKDLKSANRTWRKFNTAHKRGNEKTMTKLVTKNSIKKEQSIFPNQYQNGVITGIGPDEDFSKRIWTIQLVIYHPCSLLPMAISSFSAPCLNPQNLQTPSGSGASHHWPAQD